MDCHGCTCNQFYLRAVSKRRNWRSSFNGAVKGQRRGPSGLEWITSSLRLPLMGCDRCAMNAARFLKFSSVAAACQWHPPGYFAGGREFQPGWNSARSVSPALLPSGAHVRVPARVEPPEIDSPLLHTPALGQALFLSRRAAHRDLRRPGWCAALGTRAAPTPVGGT